jgi:hypothetical protein
MAALPSPMKSLLTREDGERPSPRVRSRAPLVPPMALLQKKSRRNENVKGRLCPTERTGLGCRRTNLHHRPCTAMWHLHLCQKMLSLQSRTHDYHLVYPADRLRQDSHLLSHHHLPPTIPLYSPPQATTHGRTNQAKTRPPQPQPRAPTPSPNSNPASRA